MLNFHQYLTNRKINKNKTTKISHCGIKHRHVNFLLCVQTINSMENKEKSDWIMDSMKR